MKEHFKQPMDFQDISNYTDLADVCKVRNVICTDDSKRYYIDAIEYKEGEGFIFHLVEAEEY